MALNDNATLVIDTGTFFLANEGTDLPADLRAPGVAWENVGHTSLEDIFGLASEGGESTSIGSLQKKVLRNKLSPRVDRFNFVLQQFDKPGLKLYLGSNAVELPNGALGAPANPVPTTKAFMVVFYDGYNVFAFHVKKAEIFRSEDMSLNDTENLAGLPLQVTCLQHGTDTHTFSVTPLGTVPTQATAGTPGVYTPSFANPANLAALTGVTASPNTSWSAGQYVQLGDGSKAKWNGTAWIAA